MIFIQFIVFNWEIKKIYQLRTGEILSMVLIIIYFFRNKWDAEFVNEYLYVCLLL